MAKPVKTNAMRQLERMGIEYRSISYDVADGAIDGLAVAKKTGQPPERVYKTLVGQGASGGVFVFCIPVADELDLKQAARAAGEKSLALVPVAQINALTGYLRGGVSPLAMKKAWPVFLWAPAMAHPTIVVSGGRAGLQMELAPQDLATAAGAQLFGQENTN
ncbi:MAG: Cys-tRNA(Pro) deacylase [Ruminococcaceae bacterium]|nr:Cys-tRNA(Pro) deacylase [Oscillospiraceae bacterium]